MAKQVLDLYELFNLVVARGGLVEVINKKQWQEIIKGLGLPSSITSAAFTLRTQYTKYLYPLEMNQHNFSNGGDLQNAIDGNKREGRRLGPYDGPMSTPVSQSSPSFSSHHHMLPHHHLPHHHRLGGAHSPPNAQSSPPPPPHHLSHPAAAAAHHAALQAAMAAGQQHPDPLAQLEMTRLALWKLYSQGQHQQGTPPHLLPPLPPLDLDQLSSSRRREQQERLLEEQQQQREQQMRKEEERRRRGEEARRRLLEAETEQRLVATTTIHQQQQQQPAEKRCREEEEEERNEQEPIIRTQEEEEAVEEAAKRRRIHEEAEEDEEDMEEEEETNTAQFSVEVSGRGQAAEPEGKSMKISMEVNGIIYSGILYAKNS